MLLRGRGQELEGSKRRKETELPLFLWHLHEDSGVFFLHRFSVWGVLLLADFG